MRVGHSDDDDDDDDDVHFVEQSAQHTHTHIHMYTLLHTPIKTINALITPKEGKIPCKPIWKEQ